MTLPRRTLLRVASLAGVGSLLLQPASLALAAAPRRKLVWIVLRGGADGLALAPPLGDPAYRAARGDLALAPSDTLPLADGFALHGALNECAGAFARGELSLLPACATPYRQRSHFDAQKVLENGTADPASRGGWLNRLVSLLPGSAMAVGQSIPLSLQGDEAVSNYASPLFDGATEQLLHSLAALYQHDALFSEQLAMAVAQRETAGNSALARGRQRFVEECRVAARFLRGDALQVAAVDFDGWDSHANQGPMLNRLLAELDAGLAVLRRELAGQWSDTLVVIATEFGRTVAANGTGGSDHGTAGLLLMAGGDLSRAGLAGGAVLGDWPGLDPGALFASRDLYPANSTFDWLGNMLAHHFNLPPEQVKRTVFPPG